MPRGLEKAAMKKTFPISSKRYLWIAFGCLAILLALIAVDSASRSVTLARATAMRTSDVPAGSSRLAPGTWERMQLLPTSSVDARWWILHAQHAIGSRELRVRSTDLDNAPDGREMHWSSSIVWLLLAMKNIPGLEGTDLATISVWSGPLLFILCLAMLGTIAWRGAGFPTASFFLLVFGSWTLIFQCFRAGETDHHGLLCALAAGCVLSAGFGLAGFLQTGRKPGGRQQQAAALTARGWFVLSGVLGGAMLWVSAATAIPVIASLALGGVLAAGINKPDSEFPVGDLWWTWSLAGGMTSAGFYLLEYFPAHMGLRLEVNHPLYSAAWIGGGYLTSLAIAKLDGIPLFRKRSQVCGALLALVAIAVPPVLVMKFARDCFWVRDPFLLALHREYILEFQTFLESAASRLSPDLLVEVFSWPVFVLAGFALYARSMPKYWRAVMAAVVCPAMVLQIMALLQVRWLVISSALWTVGVLFLVVGFLRGCLRPSKTMLAVFGIVACLNTLVFPILDLSDSVGVARKQGEIPKEWISSILLRDVAHRLVQSSPSTVPVVLSGPTSSTDLTYYSGVHTLGTLYWENRAGLVAAAGMFDATSETGALALLGRHHVSHIVLASWDDYATGYARLLRRSQGRADDKEPGFLERALSSRAGLPDWLRPLPYSIPAGFNLATEWVRIFQVVPDQTHGEALLFRGIYEIQSGSRDQGVALLNEASLALPGDERPKQWLDVAGSKAHSPSGP